MSKIEKWRQNLRRDNFISRF